MKNKIDKIVAGITFFVLVAAMVPIMYLGRYNHPTGDDYYYGVSTYLTWQDTGSIIQTVVEAIKGVKLEYEQWQGTYSALFLMHLPPNIWGNLPYRLVTTGIILLMTFGIFYFGRQLLCHLLKMSTSVWIIICSCMTILCVETVPSQGETFFWYNGSMYYTGYFAVTLIFLGFILRYMQKQKKSLLVVMFLLALFLAGGNYVTLLPTLLMTILLSAWLLYGKRAGGCEVALVAVAMLCGLVFSATAPGNYIRQEELWKIPVWKAVLKSLVQGVNYTRAWIKAWWILTACIVTPILWRSFQKISFRFPYPIVVIGLLYGIFCSMSCPTLYTMNSTGPARVVAVVYYGFILFSFAAYGYLLGYLHRIRRENEWQFFCVKRKELLWVVLAGIVVVLIIWGTDTFRECTTVKAVSLLTNGQAKAYEEEYRERYRLFMDESVQELVLAPYENQPDMLYVGDFSSDSSEPTNVKVAEYFGKRSVRVDYE